MRNCADDVLRVAQSLGWSGGRGALGKVSRREALGIPRVAHISASGVRHDAARLSRSSVEVDVTTSVWQGQVLRAFVEQVRLAAGLETTAEAEAVSRATLRTLAERVSAGQVDDLMQGLPTELRRELSQRSGQARSFDRGGFVERVSGEITTADADAADHQARAVLRVLQDWSPTGEIDRTIDQLPPALAAMFREGA